MLGYTCDDHRTDEHGVNVTLARKAVAGIRICGKMAAEWRALWMNWHQGDDLSARQT